MTTTTETTAAGDTRRRVTGRHILIAVIAAAVAAALAVVLLITTGQSDQISSLRSANASQSAQIAGLNKQLGQLKTAQANSDQAARTRDQANTATLGVCVQETYGTQYDPQAVGSVLITSPTLVNGVASCPNGTFTPVSPQTQRTPAP
jgi:nitrogen fixation protein FixH